MSDDTDFPIDSKHAETVADRLQTFRPKSTIPSSVYIHIPFCRHRCGYCNFTLVANRDYLIQRFLAALKSEINLLDRTYPLKTLFLGGGTPSHLSPKQIDKLAQTLRAKFQFDSSTEVTAECNPNDVTHDRMAALANLGVNRISLGVQSLNIGKLKTLERDHSPADVRFAVDIARSFGATLSLDMIFAAPQETISQWQTDLKSAISLAPDHLSTYELTYEKGTRFWNERNRGRLIASDEDLRAEMYSFAIEYLEQTGMKQYEVSSFARRGSQCRHNLGYWTGDPFLAFGPGAARFVDGIRETNHQSTTQYLKLIESGKSAVSDRERLEPVAAARERLAIGLRMIEGLSESDFLDRTGFTIRDTLGPLADTLLKHQLLVAKNGTWFLTDRGVMVFDQVASEIVGQQP